MQKVKNIQMSFSEIYVQKRTKKAKFFNEIDLIIDWNKLDKPLSKYYTKGLSAVGRPSYEGILLFKMLLLGTWYGLSDESVEEMVLDSLSAMKFCGLDLEEEVPDHSTLSRFRKMLNENKAWDKLLLAFNKQLKSKGIMLKQGSAKVDASLTESCYKPSKPKSYEIAEDRKEDNRSDEDKKQEKLYQNKLNKENTSVDSQARWVKKSGKYHFGYKKHVVTDTDGMIEAVHTTTANQHDSKSLKTVLRKVPKSKKKELYADKAYKSKKHDEYLAKENIKNRVQCKATKNKPLTNWEKTFNRLISKKRWVIERTFGSIRKWFKSTHTRYKGMAKTHGQHVMEAIAHNLKRSPGLVWERASKS